jgi:hypothetical protein
MPIVKRRASTILGAFDQAQTEFVGKAVILTDGKAGTVEQVWLDEHHGLRISIRGHYGKWPVSTIKLAQTVSRPWTVHNTARSIGRMPSLDEIGAK